MSNVRGPSPEYSRAAKSTHRVPSGGSPRPAASNMVNGSKGARSAQRGKPRSSLTFQEKQERDTRMQRFLNVLRMHRVHKAVEAATFQVDYADFARYEIDLDTIRCVDPTGQAWNIVGYDGTLVYLRKAAL